PLALLRYVVPVQALIGVEGHKRFRLLFGVERSQKTGGRLNHRRFLLFSACLCGERGSRRQRTAENHFTSCQHTHSSGDQRSLETPASMSIRPTPSCPW